MSLRNSHIQDLRMSIIKVSRLSASYYRILKPRLHLVLCGPLSGSFIMSATATVTSMLAVGTTPYPIQKGCDNPMIKITNTLRAYDPAYTPRPGNLDPTPLPCLPTAVTSWWHSEWDQRTVNGTTTVYRISPLVCPAGYKTMPTYKLIDSKTFAGCCPNGYTWGSGLEMQPPPLPHQCFSFLTEGQTATFMSWSMEANIRTTTARWELLTSPVEADETVFAVPVNGFVGSTGFILDPSNAAPTGGKGGDDGDLLSEPPSLNGPNVVGIAVGVSIAGIVVLGFIIFAVWLRRRRRIQRKMKKSKTVSASKKRHIKHYNREGTEIGTGAPTRPPQAAVELSTMPVRTKPNQGDEQPREALNSEITQAISSPREPDPHEVRTLNPVDNVAGPGSGPSGPWTPDRANSPSTVGYRVY